MSEAWPSAPPSRGAAACRWRTGGLQAVCVRLIAVACESVMDLGRRTGWPGGLPCPTVSAHELPEPAAAGRRLPRHRRSWRHNKAE